MTLYWSWSPVLDPKPDLVCRPIRSLGWPAKGVGMTTMGLSPRSLQWPDTALRIVAVLVSRSFDGGNPLVHFAWSGSCGLV